ncbi:hypothetical protein A1F94_008589 [Pyrenophora tritici-repentis]|nr:hypothetical protein A1F94_008589 [Pyrenophora tritici-repentis]
MVDTGKTYQNSEENAKDDPQAPLIQPGPDDSAPYKLPWPLMGPLSKNNEARNVADNWIGNELLPRLEDKYGPQAVKSNMISGYWPGLFDKAMVLGAMLSRCLERNNDCDIDHVVSEILSGQTLNDLYATVANQNTEFLINSLGIM